MTALTPPERTWRDELVRSQKCQKPKLRAGPDHACRCAVSDGVPRRSLYVALVVGTILNLINQGDAILGEAPINWLKIVLTISFPMPYAHTARFRRR